MKLLFDFFPILVFFVCFKLYGIYFATAAFLIASILQMAYQWYKHRHFEQMHIVTFCLGMVFGTATLLLHDALFIKWKPTVIYWACSIVFITSQFFGAKPLIERMLEANISLPRPIWYRLNWSWSIFFILMGIINLYVIYHYSTNTWVNFKLFGMLGMTIVFILIQAVYMSKHLQHSKESSS
ncbi:MAG: septation protein A [Pseudomonadota bacterium]